MKLVLCVVLIFGFAYVGYCISRTYVTRKKFFFAFGNYLNDLRVDVNFSFKKLGQILTGYNSDSSEFNRLLENYKASLDNAILQKEGLFKGITILNAEEKEYVYLFFKSLGKTDVFNQVSIIDGLIETNKNYLNKASEESKKYGTLYTKLGIMMGAFVALLII